MVAAETYGAAFYSFALSVTSCVFFGSAACSSKLDGNASPRRDIVDEGVDGGVWVGACVYVCLLLRVIVLPTAACFHDVWCVMVSEYVAMDVCVRMRNVGRQPISELEAS